MASTLALALARSVSASSSSIYLPWRTSSTPAKPSPPRAWAMARPWGSRTPFLRVIWTFAFMRFPVGALLHRIRAGHVAGAAFGHDAQTPRDLLIGLCHLAEIAAEAVLVQLLVGLDVPEPAIVRADLVGQHDAHVVAFPEPAEFEFEVDELQADAKEEAGEEVVDPERERQDLVQLLGRRPAEGGDVLLRDHRVAELVGLVIVLDDGAGQDRALRQAEACRQRARGDVADDDLERNDLHLAHQLLAHVEAAHEVGRDAGLPQARHQIFRDPVVEHPLAGDGALLLIVEGGGVVLEILDERAGFWPLIQNLRLAFIDAALAGHRRFSRCQESG